MNDEVLNPVDIETAIRRCADRIHEGVKVTTDRERIAREATRLHDRAYAHAYLAAEGPAHEKKYRAELATATERDLGDVEAELRAWQSVGASVRTMYGAQR